MFLLVLIPVIVYMENVNLEVCSQMKLLNVQFNHLCVFQNVHLKVFAVSKFIHKNRNVAQIFSCIMAVCIYGLVMLHSVSKHFCRNY
jgi:hypothetical protein